MNKRIALILALLMMLAMTACTRPNDSGMISGSSVSGSEVSGANAPAPEKPAKKVESPVAKNDKYITKTLEDELIISYPTTFSEEMNAGGMLLAVAQPGGNNIIVSSENISSEGLETALSEPVLKAQLEAQGSSLIKYQQVACGNGHGAKLLARAENPDGSVRNQTVFILINSAKNKAYYVILTTKDADFSAFGGMENYVLLK